ETVTISADFEQPESEVAKTVSTVGEKEIEARQETNAVDAVRTLPGVRVQQLGGFGRTANIKTRGLRNQDTAVLIDGIRFRDVSGISGDATPFISDLSLAGVRSEEHTSELQSRENLVCRL